MTNRYFLAFAILASFLFVDPAFGQMVGDCVFLKGKYVEVGIAPNGGYGSTLPAPAGYHPFLGPATSITFYDPGAATSSTSTQFLGFVADYGADGWGVGSPGYFGDYYLPGDPQEGWSLQIGTQASDAYIPAYQVVGTTGFANSGGATLTGTNLAYVNAGGVSRGIWTGTQGALAIRQTTILDTNKLYFTVNVILTNTGATPLTNIYYIRTVDPDNEETNTGLPGFTTLNTITYQLPNPTNRVLVSATGLSYGTNAYLGLGTKDCRAKCMFFDLGLAPSYTLQNIYNQTTPYSYIQGSTSTADVGIGLVYNIGTIAPGDSTTLSYAYILNASFIDSALNATQPSFTVNGVAHDSTDTINFCSYPFDTIAIKILNGGFYHWHYRPGTFLSDTTGMSVTVHSDSITADITYTITGTNTSGGCDSVHYYLTVQHGSFPGPVTIPVSYCQNAPTSQLTAPGSGLTWWTSPTGGTGSAVAPTPSSVIPGTTTYYVSQAFGVCESDRSPLVVTIIPNPPPPGITGINPYCFGQTFVPFTTSGTGILWYTFPTGGIGIPTPPVVNTGAPGTYINYASQTVSGCEGPRASITTVVLPQITAGFTYEKHWGCHGDTIRFFNSSVNATRYSWSFGDVTSDTTPNATHVYSAQGTFTAKLYAVNEAGCADSMIQTISLVHPLKSSFTDAPGIICQKQSVTFTNASVGTNPTYMWYFGNGATDTATNTTYTYQHTGVYTVKLIVKDFVPCYDTSSRVVYVDTISGIRMELTDSVLCTGNYITLKGLYADIGNTGVTWSFGDANTMEQVNPVYHAFAGAGQYTISVRAHYRACPDTGTTRIVNVYAQPTIDLGRDTTICKGGLAIILKDNNNRDNSSASYVWSTGEKTRSITVVAPGNYYATVNVNNCHSSDTVVVGNDCYMDIPNAFTPNGDGINDYFYPRQLLTKGLTAFKMNIYNRWGQLIFETTSVDGVGWDGRLNNIDQPEGVYVYIIDATFKDGQSEHHQGNITLLR